MSDETRTPNANTVRSVFVRAHPFSASTSYEDRRAEFDRFIARIKAEAWDEGWSAGYTDAVDDEHPQATGRHEPNPHRIEREA
ncbi:MAG: hypothetical protein ACTIIT_13905 [Brevibacterium linens]